MEELVGLMQRFCTLANKWPRPDADERSYHRLYGRIENMIFEIRTVTEAYELYCHARRLENLTLLGMAEMRLGMLTR